MSDNALIAALQAAFSQAVQAAVSTHVTELAAKVAALEAQMAPRPVQAEDLDNQEWFWGKVANFVQAENAKLDYEKIAEHVSLSDLAGELTSSQLQDIAGEIDLSDLADELDAEKLMQKFDLDEALKDWFAEQSFSITP